METELIKKIATTLKCTFVGVIGNGKVGRVKILNAKPKESHEALKIVEKEILSGDSYSHNNEFPHSKDVAHVVLCARNDVFTGLKKSVEDIIGSPATNFNAGKRKDKTQRPYSLNGKSIPSLRITIHEFFAVAEMHKLEKVTVKNEVMV